MSILVLKPKRLKVARTLMLWVALHALARTTHGTDVVMCSDAVTTKSSVPPLLLQDEQQWDPLWVPRLGFAVEARSSAAHAEPDSFGSSIRSNSSDPWRDALVASSCHFFRMARHAGHTLILVRSSLIVHDAARRHQDSTIRAAAAATENVGHADWPRQLGHSAAAELKNSQRTLESRGKSRMFCAVIDDLSLQGDDLDQADLSNRQGSTRGWSSATVAAAFCRGHIDFFLLDTRAADSSSARLHAHWTALLKLKEQGITRRVGLAHPTLAQLQLLEGWNSAWRRNEVSPELVRKLGVDVVFAHLLPTPGEELVADDGQSSSGSRQLSPRGKSKRSRTHGARKVEALISHCNDHQVTLLSAPPTIATLQHPVTMELAARHALEPAHVIGRYAVQRGFIQVGSGPLSPRGVAAVQLTLGDVDSITCLTNGTVGSVATCASSLQRGVKGCYSGIAAPKARRKYLEVKNSARPDFDAWVSIPTGAWDPVVLGGPLYHRGAPSALARELRLAASMEVPAAPWRLARPLEAYHTLRHASDSGPHVLLNGAGETIGYDTCTWRQCRLGFAAVTPPQPSEQSMCADKRAALPEHGSMRPYFTGCFMDARYLELVQRVSASISNWQARDASMHVTNVNPARNHPRETDTQGWTSFTAVSSADPYDKIVRALIDEYIKPFVVGTYYEPACLPTTYSYHFIFVKHAEDERARGPFSAWHWDGGGKGLLQTMMYLTDTDHERACFMILRHNTTGEPFLVDGSRPWHWAIQPSVVPREWLSELFAKGYWPHCVAGPAGTLIVRQANAIHRGSRPKPGSHRQALVVRFHLPKPDGAGTCA